jgi:hypothetical protein
MEYLEETTGLVQSGGDSTRSAVKGAQAHRGRAVEVQLAEQRLLLLNTG